MHRFRVTRVTGGTAPAARRAITGAGLAAAVLAAAGPATAATVTARIIPQDPASPPPWPAARNPVGPGPVPAHLAGPVAGGWAAALAGDPGDPGAGALSRAAVDLWRGVDHLAEDAWAVVTSPAHMDRGDALMLAGVLGVGGLLYVWDEGLYDALRRREGHALHDGLRDLGDFAEPVGLMGNTNKWYGLGVLVGYVSGWDPLLHVSRDLLAGHWLAAATYNPPRSWIGRRRPEDDLGPRAFGGGTSLPSGHASSIVQVAAVLSHHVSWRPARIAFWGLAGAVLLQRVDTGKHWPSDVWLGAAWGYGVTRLVLDRADARRSPAASPGPPAGLRVAPFVDPGSGALGLSVRLATGGL